MLGGWALGIGDVAAVGVELVVELVVAEPVAVVGLVVELVFA